MAKKKSDSKRKSVKNDKVWEVVKEFEKRKLAGQSMLYTNGVGVFMFKNKNEMFDSVVEAISSISDVVECIPETAIVKFKGIQLVIETKGDIDKETMDRLKNYGYLIQGSHFYDDKNASTEIFGQTPENYDENFEEFLRTYPEFLRKKFEERRS